MKFVKIFFQILFSPVRIFIYLNYLRKFNKKQYIEILIDGDLKETPPISGLLSYIKPEEDKYYDLFLELLSLEQYLKKPRFASKIKEIRFIIKDPDISWARAWECRDLIASISKKVSTVAYIEVGTSMVYYIALGCSKIYTPPSLNIDLLGFGSYGMFYKKALEKVGITSNFLSIGDYKSAGERYTRDSHSKYARQQIQDLLDGLKENYNSSLLNSRGSKIKNTSKKPSVLDTLQKQGIFTAKEALEEGLIDGFLYLHQLDELNKVLFQDKSIEHKSLQEVVHLFSKVAKPFIGKKTVKKIAFVVGEGIILDADQSKGDSINYKDYKEAFQDIANADYEAVILRWNSPGGSAFVSDQLWAEINAITSSDTPKIEEILAQDKYIDISASLQKDLATSIESTNNSKKKKKKKKKMKKEVKDHTPFIFVSQSDVAASGGYYLSAVGGRIYSSPLTITGSIGVLAGKFNISPLLKKVGVDLDLVESGSNSNIYSPFANFSGSQKKRLEETMYMAYDLFLDRIHKGRSSLSIDVLKKLGGGRVYSGTQAYENGLVDNLGGLKSVFVDIRKKLNMKDDEEIELDIYPKVKTSIFSNFIPTPPFLQKLLNFQKLEKESVFYLDDRLISPKSYRR